MQTHRGSCHCGAVTFEVDANLADERILECNCSICRKKANLHLIVDRERFRLLSGEEDLSEYRFGTQVAVHRFCRTCGIHPFYSPRSHPGMVSVNVRCLDDVDLETVAVETFDGANWEENVGGIR
jgi:hypothetical protein